MLKWVLMVWRATYENVPMSLPLVHRSRLRHSQHVDSLHEMVRSIHGNNLATHTSYLIHPDR